MAPEIKAPKAIPKGAKIVSTAPASSGLSFNFWEINPDLPELVIRLPTNLPKLINKMLKKFKTGIKAPNKIEEIPTINPP